MNKTLIYILIVLVVIIGVFLSVGKYRKTELVKEAQTKAELFVKKNYEDIDAVTINKDNYKFYPADLGGLSITGYVNGNKKLFFSVDFDTLDNRVGKVTSVFRSKDFPSKKEECKDSYCQ